MPKRLLQELRGVGAIYAGEHLLRSVPYVLSIWSESSLPPGEGPAPAVSIEGRLDLTGMGEAVVLAGAPALTLHLEDGRRLRFNLLSTSGRIAGLGNLTPAR